MCLEKEDQVYCVICPCCDRLRGQPGDVEPHTSLKQRHSHRCFDGQYAGHTETIYVCADCGAWLGLIQEPGTWPFRDFWTQRWPPNPWRFDEEILDAMEDPVLRKVGRLMNQGLCDREIARSMGSRLGIVRRQLNQIHRQHLNVLGRHESLRRGLL